MPPVKTRLKPKASPEDGTTALAILYLMRANVREVRRWYRGARDPGHYTGHIVMQEMIFANIETAMDMAFDGKNWEAPGVTP